MGVLKRFVFYLTVYYFIINPKICQVSTAYPRGEINRGFELFFDCISLLICTLGYGNKKRFAINFDDTESMTLTGKRKTALIIFAGTFLLMIYSVIPFSDLGITFLPTLGWYFTELSGLFLVAGIIVGIEEWEITKLLI